MNISCNSSICIKDALLNPSFHSPQHSNRNSTKSLASRAIKFKFFWYVRLQTAKLIEFSRSPFSSTQSQSGSTPILLLILMTVILTFNTGHGSQVTGRDKETNP